MLIAGMHTLTLLDFPGKVACVVFTAGCNMRCRYCHNPQLVLPDEIRRFSNHIISEEDFFRFLKSRRGLLDGVVVSGGEPTVQADLIPFIRRIKAMNFLVKLDTNGTNPAVLGQMFDEKLLDYVAMDVKASLDKYDGLTQIKNNISALKRSRDLILKSGIDHEFRTTVIHGFHDLNEVKKITRFCKGAQKYTLQNFRNGKTLDPSFGKHSPCSDEELAAFQQEAEKYISNVEVLS